MVQLRAMTPADLFDVLELWQAVPEMCLNDSDTPEQLTKYLARNPELSPVATSADKVVGAALCGHDGRRGYLNHLAVAPDYRKSGLGQALVEYCVAHLSDLEIIGCNIFVSPENSAGLAFWHKQGFEAKTWTFLQRRTE